MHRFLINIYIIFWSPNPAKSFFLNYSCKCDIEVTQTDGELLIVENTVVSEDTGWSR